MKKANLGVSGHGPQGGSILSHMAGNGLCIPPINGWWWLGDGKNDCFTLTRHGGFLKWSPNTNDLVFHDFGWFGDPWLKLHVMGKGNDTWEVLIVSGLAGLQFEGKPLANSAGQRFKGSTLWREVLRLWRGPLMFFPMHLPSISSNDRRKIADQHHILLLVLHAHMPSRPVKFAPPTLCWVLGVGQSLGLNPTNDAF